jgi:hypothetical protein
LKSCKMLIASTITGMSELLPIIIPTLAII